MGLLDRYLFRQLLGPTLLAAVSLCLVGVLSQSLQALDLMVKQGQSALVLAEITALATPQLLATVLPIAVFVAGLVALNRLHTEQEIVVCFASGMSRWRVIAPAMRLAAVAALIILAVNLWVAPFCERAMRVELFKVKTDLAATLVEPGQFTEPAPGLTVYVQDVAHGGLKNLFVLQEKPGGGDTTFIAASGTIGKRNGAPVLTMHNASRQEFSKSGVLTYLTFDEYTFDLSDLLLVKDQVRYKVPDRYMHELLFPDLRQPWERANRLKMLAEANARLATPLYAMAFMAMAMAAVIGGPFSRLGYARRILIASGLAAVTRIAGAGAQALCDTQVWANALQYAIPLAATFWAFREIFRQPVSRFVPLHPLTGSTLMPSPAE
ncbi:MAG TPA: LPS export ABC transporter permease LptF [Caulobacteraceae bacterium]|nr:LPS export ABC transporter permease LptF [Caulobacteraceae bacterium]